MLRLSKVVFIKSNMWIVPLVTFFIILYYIFLNLQLNDINIKINVLEKILVTQFLLYIFINIFMNGINTFFSKAFNNFLLMLGVFHIGIPIAHIFGYSNEYFEEIIFWYYSPITLYALLNVTVFFNAYLFSNIIDFKPKSNLPIRQNSHTFFKLNFVVLTMSVIVWIVHIYFVLGLREYKEFYETSDLSFTITFIYLTAVIGISFLVSILNNSFKYPLIIFLIWVLFAFSLGVRGPALYPLALGAAILITRQVVKVSLLKFLFGSIIFLSLLSYKFRERSNLDISTYIDPLAAIQEMGGSLRPVYEVNYWLKITNIDFYMGSTYFAPFERTFNSIFRVYENIPAQLDGRLMNVVIYDKAGPYGFSIIAEAMVNFSNIGVFVLGMLVGTFFKWFDYKSKYLALSAFLMVFAYGFFYHIRQAFVSTYGIVAIGLIYVFLISVISKLINKLVNTQ